jgi:hypothetical protein
VSEKLRLKATDAEDLGVIAACLQDARIPLREMVFSPEERRFAGAFTRYRRERQADWSSCEGLTECLAALVFDEIDEVKYRELDPADPGRELTLLTIATGPGKGHLIHIDFVFEGDAQIQLRTNRIACRLDDFGAPEPCKVTPCDHLGQGWIAEAPAS